MTSLPTQPAGSNTSRDEQAFFQGYYDVQVPVSGPEYDAVLAFFLARTNNEETAALSLTTSLLEVTHNRGIRPMELLEQFKRYNNNEDFKSALIGLFNSYRAASSRIGYSKPQTRSAQLERNIRK